MSQTCKNCSQNFSPHPDDLSFYEKVGVPVPNYCPPCRMQRRLAHRNERTLYRRPCDKCKTDGVSIYPPGTPWPVYCNPCWWGDSWDAKEYGQDYDSSRPFFEQYIELRNKVPRINLLSITSVNSEYTNNAEDNKNCYLIFAAHKNEDCMYGRLVQRCKSVVDTAWIYDSELCYEGLDVRQCYGCMFCERCQTSRNLLLCFDVRDSQDCILCTNVRHGKYMIENKQCTKEEYEAKKKEILASRESLDVAISRFEQLKSETIVKYAFQTKCVNTTGDYLYNVHSSRMMFDTENAKDCAYMADTDSPQDCLDGNNMYYKPEKCLDIMGTLQSYGCKFSTYVIYCNSVEYSDGLQSCENCFGSIGLKKSGHCILNKQYDKETYEKLRAQIIADMKKQGVYGDFLPPVTSPFTYNETMAKDYFTLSEAEAKSKGFQWGSVQQGTYGKENGIDVFACSTCKKNFKITPTEFEFYKRMGLPLPLKDFECRMQDRLRKRNPRTLWHRSCMCTTTHPSHQGVCQNEFETTYAPDRKEIVYCESCYQSEVV